jgi:tRNA1(Val) A37 N6-methylase TrmN6
MAEGDGQGLFAGRIRLAQLGTGHRVGTDAVLLAAAAPLDRVRRAADLGAGVGAVGLLYAVDNSEAEVRLLEIDPEAAALARTNISLNGLERRVGVEVGDALATVSAEPPFDLVLTNPPYLPAGRVRAAATKERAHVMPAGGLDAWVKAALRRLAPGGRLVLIHRADALPDVLQALDRRFGAVTVRPVHPREDAPASRVLVCATKGSRGPFSLLPRLVLHTGAGGFAPLAAAIHRGEARLAWD